MGEDETLKLWITIFQKKPMHTAFKRLEPHMRDCSNNMVWETIPDSRSCVDEKFLSSWWIFGELKI